MDGDEVHATFTIVTKAALAGRRVVARVDETFLIPMSDGKIHHIRARLARLSSATDSPRHTIAVSAHIEPSRV